MKNKTVTLSGVFCVLIGNTRSISTVKEIKPSPYTPDLATQRRYRRVWSIIVSTWTVKKSPPSVKAQTTQKVEIARLLSNSILTPYDRMVTCHAVIFVFLHCHHAARRQLAAVGGLPRCRSPPHSRRFETCISSNFWRSYCGQKMFLHSFSKKFFNPPNSPAVYLLLLAPESDGKGARAWPQLSGGKSYWKCCV